MQESGAGNAAGSGTGSGARGSGAGNALFVMLIECAHLDVH